LNVVDAILAIIIISLSYSGYKKGFLRSIFSLAGIIAGLILAVKFHSYLNPLIKPFSGNDKLNNLLSFLIVLICTYFLFIFISSRISKINKITKTADRITGTVFGFIKGIIIASLFTIVFSTFNIFSETRLNNSFLYSKIGNIAIDTFNYINKFISTDKSVKDLKYFLSKDTINNK